MAGLFERRIICKEKECNRYELLTEECLKIHKLLFHRNQHFEEGHSCKKDKDKLKYRTLIETNIQGETKYRDENCNKYPDIKSFQNRTSLPETEIQESLKKRKWNIISPRVKGRAE